MGVKPSLETLMNWLKEGSDNPSNIVDVKWVIEEEKRDENGLLKSFRAIYPNVPLALLAILMDVDEESGGRKVEVVRLVIETPLNTMALDLKEREYVYRILLQMSRYPMIKYYLYGDNLNIAVAADLDLKSLGKGEFDDTLAFLLAGALYLYDKFGAREALSLELLRNVSILISNYIKQGWSRDRLINYLVDKAGMPREMAEELVDKYMKGREGEDSGLFI